MQHDAASIWEACSGKLRAYLRHHLRSAADADDVRQEAFVRVHRYAGQLDREAHLSGWLFAVARCALVDFRRRHTKPTDISRPSLRTRAIALHVGLILAGGVLCGYGYEAFVALR